MIVVTVSSCPTKLRGDLTKWFFEIDTGVFVGNLSARVRDAVWKRICENIGSGRATMVFNTNSEQKLDFRICNSDWEPTDYDGLKLVRRKIETGNKVSENKTSMVQQNHIARNIQRSKKSINDLRDYVVIDIETTGFDNLTDQIIEIGAVAVKDGSVAAEFSALLKTDISLPKNIVELTGITDEMLRNDGRNAKEVLEELKEFCGNMELVGHNIVVFDMSFLRTAFSKNNLEPMGNKMNDTLRIARRRIDDYNGYELRDLAKYFKIEHGNLHRGLNDCLLTYKIFEELKKI